MGQGGGVPGGEGLAGVKDGVDAGAGAGGGEVDHIGEVAGGDDADGLRRVDAGEVKAGGMLHSAGVEGGNLVVVLVGDDECGGGGFGVHDADVGGGYAGGVQAGEVVVVVGADGGDEAGALAQHSQGVGDVAGGAAEVLAEAGHGEAEVDLVGALRDDVVAEASGEGHYAVDGEGTGNQDLHLGCSFGDVGLAMGWTDGG